MEETPRSLPVYPVDPGRRDSGVLVRGRQPQPETGASGRILVVDDDAMDRQVMCHYLAAGDYSAVAAAGGTEALDLLGSGAL